MNATKTQEPQQPRKRVKRPRAKKAVSSDGASGSAGWQWITHKPSRSTLYISLISVALGVALAVAWQQNRTSDELANARPGDLVQILDRLSVERNRLQAELSDLLRREETLTEGATSEALAETQARANQFAILAGVVPVTGPGIEVLIRDPSLNLSSVALLDLVQELRDAGAEAISINDERVVASTWFADAPGGTSVSGVTLAPPYRVKAIGDPRTMEVALAIPGGFSESVRSAGGTVSVIRLEQLDILAVVPPLDPTAPRP